jgi:hypothetical protein
VCFAKARDLLNFTVSDYFNFSCFFTHYPEMNSGFTNFAPFTPRCRVLLPRCAIWPPDKMIYLATTFPYHALTQTAPDQPTRPRPAPTTADTASFNLLQKQQHRLIFIAVQQTSVRANWHKFLDSQIVDGE